MFDFDDIDENLPERTANPKRSLDGEWDCRVDYFRNGGLQEIEMRIKGHRGEYKVAGGSQTHQLLDIYTREERYSVKVDFRWANARGQRGSGTWTLRASGNVLDGTWSQDGVADGPWKWTGMRKAADVAIALPEADAGPPLPSIDGDWDCICDAYKIGEMVNFCMTINGSDGHFELDYQAYVLTDVKSAWDGSMVSVTFKWETYRAPSLKTRNGAGCWLLNTATGRLNGGWTQDGLSSGPWMWNCTKRKVVAPPPAPVLVPVACDADGSQAGEVASEPSTQAAPPEPLELSITRDQAVQLQAELLAAYTGEDFHRRLEDIRAGGGSSRKQAEARATICAQAQRKILPKYGFDTSRKGLMQSAVELEALAATDPEVASNNELLRWLQAPEPQAENGSGPADSPSQSSKFSLKVTDPYDEAAVRRIERLRGSLACAHQDLYRGIYPGLQQQEWMSAIGRDNMVEYIKTEGTVVLHAESPDTGEVVGYVSCQVVGLDSDACSSSSGDTPRPDTRAMDFDSLGDLDARGRSDQPAEAREPGFGEFSGPNATIGHIAVLEEYRGRGIGRMLFEGLLTHLKEAFPVAAVDLRINVVELNARAIDWYRRLGFVPVDLWVRRFSFKTGLVPVVFLTMQRREDAPCVPWKRFFVAEARGAKVIVFPEEAPKEFLHDAFRQAWSRLPPATVGVFDLTDGFHELLDGRVVDLTQAFLDGRVRFEKPLHTVVSS